MTVQAIRPTDALKTLRDKGVSGSNDYDLKRVLDYVGNLEADYLDLEARYTAVCDPCFTPVERR